MKRDIKRVRTIDEVRDFMAGSEPVDFRLTDRRGAYDFVTRTLRRLNYAGLSQAVHGELPNVDGVRTCARAHPDAAKQGFGAAGAGAFRGC